MGIDFDSPHWHWWDLRSGDYIDIQFIFFTQEIVCLYSGGWLIPGRRIYFKVDLQSGKYSTRARETPSSVLRISTKNKVHCVDPWTCEGKQDRRMIWK